MLNTLPPKAQGRQPRGLVYINGQSLLWENIEVDTTTYYQADSFSVTLPLNGQPKGYDFSYFASAPAMLIEIYAGLPNNSEQFTKSDLDNLITGQVDDIAIDPVTATLTLTGRDLTAKFIDNKTTEKFQNNTSSQIAAILAQRRGLTPVVKATSTLAGRYYEIDHSRLTSQHSEWDLLTYLAQEENYAVFVKGMSLYFQPVPSPSDNPYVIQWTSSDTDGTSINVVDLKCTRNLTLARDVIVTVRSWNAKQKQGFTKTVKATPNKDTAVASQAQPVGDSQVYTYSIPGLTPEQALQKAQQLLQQITQHERNIAFTVPADSLLDKSKIIQLKGTNTDFDQIYYPSSIRRTMSLDSGYVMHVEAKNHSPNTQVIV